MLENSKWDFKFLFCNNLTEVQTEDNSVSICYDYNGGTHLKMYCSLIIGSLSIWIVPEYGNMVLKIQCIIECLLLRNMINHIQRKHIRIFLKCQFSVCFRVVNMRNKEKKKESKFHWIFEGTVCLVIIWSLLIHPNLKESNTDFF